VNADEFLFDVAQQADANRRAALIADLTALRLIVEFTDCTVEQALERLSQVFQGAPPHYQGQEVEQRVAQLAEALRLSFQPAPPPWRPEVIEGGQGPEAL
jgi:hypothetical protein